MSWIRLFDDDTTHRVHTHVNNLAVALRANPPEIRGPGFATGESGIGLFYAFLASLSGRDEHAHLAERYLESAMERLAKEPVSLGLFGGLAGVAWTSRQIELLLRGSADESLTEEVDELLMDALHASPWPLEYDLVYGLAGLGCYAANHNDASYASSLLELTVTRLRELSERDRDGARWLTRPELIKRPSDRQSSPNGHYNLGVSHGIGGVIGFLSLACTSPWEPAEARELLREAVSWLLVNRRDAEGSTFGGFAEANPPSCRSAWCYGDPGLAWALLWASRALGQPSLQSEALRILRRDLSRPFEETGVVDAGLCHGTAGIAHLLNRVSQATEAEDLAQMAHLWFDKTLKLCCPTHSSPGGYAAWWPEEKKWQPDGSLLTGGAGVGLALLSAASEEEPAWDMPLMWGSPPHKIDPSIKV